jgi:flagellar export protein FliJ
MKKFRFSLQAALQLRERAVELAEAALRLVQDEWNANQLAQQTLAAEVREAEIALQSQGNAVDPADFLALDRFRSAAHRRRLRLATEASAIAKRLAEKRHALQLAERDAALLLRLKEKAVARWQFEFDKEQQMMAEEAYISRWNQR